jgi:2-polyprenyl-3-methyl-5-hydroxy-6-metoxy-1,4-benzoquinol methylase
MLDYFFPDMQQRNTTDKEKLELPDTEPDLVRRTIAQFKLINYLFSGSDRLFQKHFFDIMEQNPDRTYTLLDVGAGGCDIAIRAARTARRRDLKLHITALDNDKRLLPFARHAIRDYPEIRLVEGDALDLSRLAPFDFVFSNHLLHHLSWDEMKTCLESIIPQTRLAFVMDDLKRSRWAYLGFTLFSAACTPGSYHHYDGRLSIRRGFLPEELRNFIANNFPDQAIEVAVTYPARVVLSHVPTCRNGNLV